jgi:hypothetical protein
MGSLRADEDAHMQDWAQAVPTDVRMDKHNKEKKEKRSKISSGRAKVEQPTASLGLTGKYERSTNLTGKYENSEPIADEDSSERFPVMSTALSSVGRFSFFFFFFFHVFSLLLLLSSSRYKASCIFSARLASLRKHHSRRDSMHLSKIFTFAEVSFPYLSILDNASTVPFIRVHRKRS